MKMRTFFVSTVLFSAIIMTMSATSVCAQKIKYIPFTKGVKPVTIPAVINPRLSRAAQESITRWSGVAVTHTPVVATAAQATVPTTVNPALVTPVTAAPVATAAATQPALPIEDTGTNLTGVQVLATYFPTWRQELGGMFSKEQLDAVEKAFADTDETIFDIDEEGNTIYNPKRHLDDWDYHEQFKTNLLAQNVDFREEQYYRLFVLGRYNKLSGVFKLCNVTSFMLAKGHYPNRKATDEAERLFAVRLHSAERKNATKTDPLNQRLRQLRDENRIYTPKRTPQQLLEELEEYLKDHNDEYPLPGSSLYIAVLHATTHHDLNDPVISRLEAIKRAHQKMATPQTPAQTLAKLETWLAQHPDKIFPDFNSIDREEKALYTAATNAYYRAKDKNDPVIVKLGGYIMDKKVRTDAMPTEQVFAELVKYVSTEKKYPKWDSYLYNTIHKRLRRHQSTMTPDGKYADPWLQKIYELKTAVQNAPEGKFTIVSDGQGGYILEIEEPALEEEITAPQLVEEVAPAAPSPHTIRLRINEQTKNLIESVRDAAALERREFPGWLRSMHSAENFPQIVNQNTFDALHALSKAIGYDHRIGQNRHAVTYLLQTVNNYVGALGEQPELGAFYKLIYRGKVDPAMLPNADDFHLVAEEQGLSWDGELAPQVENVNRLLTQAVKQDTPFSVYLDGDEEMLTTIRTEGNVPAKTIHDDLSTVLTHLLPPGYEVRMGLHEIGVSGRDLSKFRKGYLHLHMDHVSVPDGDMEGLLIDHSISLDVDVRRFANRWNPATREYDPLLNKDIAQNYLELFDGLLSDEARQTLQQMADSSSK